MSGSLFVAGKKKVKVGRIMNSVEHGKDGTSWVPEDVLDIMTQCECLFERRDHVERVPPPHPAEAPPQNTAVMCRGVTKQFGAGEAAVMALRGIDLDVYAGQMTLLKGPSGSGKSTLLAVLSGLLRYLIGGTR